METEHARRQAVYEREVWMAHDDKTDAVQFVSCLGSRHGACSRKAGLAQPPCPLCPLIPGAAETDAAGRLGTTKPWPQGLSGFRDLAFQELVNFFLLLCQKEAQR